jgi:hypothetical protein
MFSLRQRFYLALIAFPICEIICAVLWSNRPWFPIPFFGIVIACGGYTLLLRCPKCRKPIGITYWGPIQISHPWAERICSKCGFDLTQSIQP